MKFRIAALVALLTVIAVMIAMPGAMIVLLLGVGASVEAA